MKSLQVITLGCSKNTVDTERLLARVLYQGAIRRFDRYAELDNAIYLIDYKTGKPNEKYNEQVQLYSKALKEMTDKEIRTFLVYLSEDTIHITTTSGVALR